MKPLFARSGMLASMSLTVLAWLGTGGGANADIKSARSCIKDFQSKIIALAPKEDVKPEKVQEWLAEVAKFTGITPVLDDIKVIACYNGEKAESWRPSAQEVEAGLILADYIIYNPVWIREVIGSDRAQGIVIFAHELAHLFLDHFDKRAAEPKDKQERDADYYAGCASAHAKSDWNAVEALLKKLRAEDGGLYPSRFASLDAAREGFQNCSGKGVQSASEKCHEIGFADYSKVPPLYKKMISCEK